MTLRYILARYEQVGPEHFEKRHRTTTDQEQVAKLITELRHPWTVIAVEVDGYDPEAALEEMVASFTGVKQ